MTTFTFAPGMAAVYSLTRFVPNPGHHLMNDTSESVDTREKLFEVGEVGLLKVVVDQIRDILGDGVVSSLGSPNLHAPFLVLVDPKGDVGVPGAVRLAHVSQYDSHTNKCTRLSEMAVFQYSHNTKLSDCITVIRYMAPSDENFGAKLSFWVPTNWKSAIEDLAWNRSSKHEVTKQSEICREALKEYIVRHKDELSEEALDALDDDLVANAGAGGGF